MDNACPPGRESTDGCRWGSVSQSRSNPEPNICAFCHLKLSMDLDSRVPAPYSDISRSGKMIEEIEEEYRVYLSLFMLL